MSFKCTEKFQKVLDPPLINIDTHAQFQTVNVRQSFPRKTQGNELFQNSDETRL